MKYKQELSRQLALDYCCNVEDILDNKNHFSEYGLWMWHVLENWIQF